MCDQMNAILRIGRKTTESIESSPEGIWGAGRELTDGCMENMALELSFNKGNRDCWIETEGCLNQRD